MSSLSKTSLIIVPFCLLSIFSCVTEPEFETESYFIQIQGSVTALPNNSPLESAFISLVQYSSPKDSSDILPQVHAQNFTDIFGNYSISANVEKHPSCDSFKVYTEHSTLLTAQPFTIKIYSGAQDAEWTNTFQRIDFQLESKIFVPPLP